MIKFVVPKDWSPHIPDSFGGERKKRYEADRQAWVMDSIIRRLSTKASAKSRGVPMNANVMLNVLGSGTYQDTIDCMIDSGCLKTDGLYRQGGHSRRYRLMVPLDSGLRAVVPTNPYLIRAVLDWSNRRPPVSPPSWIDMPSIKSDLKRLAIDRRAAWNFIRKSGWSMGSKNAAFASIASFSMRRMACDKYGRVHTWATSLKSDLRQFLSLGGEDVVVVDVANSQPLLLAAAHLACEANGGEPPARPATILRQRPGKLSTEGKQGVDVEGQGVVGDGSGACGDRDALGGLYIRYGYAFAKNASPEDGFQSYLEMCENGMFYEGLAALCDTYKTPIFKTDTFRHIFFANSHGGNGLWCRFRTLFPSIARTIYKFHTVDMESHGGIVEKCSLSTYLQTLESEIVLGDAYKAFKRISGGAPAVTIHDCLIVQRGHAQAAQDALGEAFSNIGLRVSVSTTAHVRSGSFFGRKVSERTGRHLAASVLSFE